MSTTTLTTRTSGLVVLIGVLCLVGIAAFGAQDSGKVQAVSITAHKYAFAPARIEVDQNDIVKVTLTSTDIAHSFTIDEPYRIAKRVAPGQTVTFEFRADQAGTFPFYCNLTIDEGCKKMKGELVVRGKTTK